MSETFDQWYSEMPEHKELLGLKGAYRIKGYKPKENTWALMMKALSEESWNHRQVEIHKLKQRLEEAEKVIGVYAYPSDPYRLERADSYGARAREYMANKKTIK